MTDDKLHRLRLLAGAIRVLAAHGQEQDEKEAHQLLAYIGELAEVLEAEARSGLGGK